MSDAAFLRAIIAKPDDDLPRLTYADWLDEQGEGERAEFIRVQVDVVLQESAVDRLAAGHPGDDITDRAERKLDRLRRRDQELLDAHRLAWLAGLIGPGWKVCGGADERVFFTRGAVEASGPFVPVFRRGFVEVVTCSWPDWLAHADAILAACPIRQRNAGTEEEPKWVEGTGGLVRLTTWPDVDMAIDSILTVSSGEVDVIDASDVVASDAAYPGVRFKLPPAGFTGRDHAALNALSYATGVGPSR